MDKKLSVISIATRDYTKYWKKMADSLFTRISEEVTIHVATDDIGIADGIEGLENNKNKIKIYKIPSYGWPEATLYRYSILSEIIAGIKDEFTFYLDADMIVNEDFFQLLKLKKYEIVLIAHPGFFRPTFTKRSLLYIKNPRVMISDLLAKLLHGGIGSWETRKKSTAFVSRNKRENYVCGGFWGGDTNSILEMVNELKIAVEEDRKNGIIAKWHDESHLNCWASRNDFRLESPAYCHDELYANLATTKKVVTAVRKIAK
jgi:hypothetical protein